MPSYTPGAKALIRREAMSPAKANNQVTGALVPDLIMCHVFQAARIKYTRCRSGDDSRAN